MKPLGETYDERGRLISPQIDEEVKNHLIDIKGLPITPLNHFPDLGNN